MAGHDQLHQLFLQSTAAMFLADGGIYPPGYGSPLIFSQHYLSTQIFSPHYAAPHRIMTNMPVWKALLDL